MGRPDGVPAARRAAQLHRAGLGGHTRSPAGWPTTASAAGTSSPCTCPTAASTRPFYYGVLLAGANLLPHQSAAAGGRPRGPADRRRGPRPDHLGPGAALRPQRARPPPRRRRCRYRRSARPRLRRPARARDGDVDLADLLAADPTDRRLDADLDPAVDLAHRAYTGGTTGSARVELRTNDDQRAAVGRRTPARRRAAGGGPGDAPPGPRRGRRPDPAGESPLIHLPPGFDATGAIGNPNGTVGAARRTSSRGARPGERSSTPSGTTSATAVRPRCSSPAPGAGVRRP